MKKIAILEVSIILAIMFICSESSGALYADEKVPIVHGIHLDS